MAQRENRGPGDSLPSMTLLSRSSPESSLCPGARVVLPAVVAAAAALPRPAVCGQPPGPRTARGPLGACARLCVSRAMWQDGPWRLVDWPQSPHASLFAAAFSRVIALPSWLVPRAG